MPITISTPYLSGTVSSTTSTTITDSTASFTSAVVGRFFRINATVAGRGGQIRKIVAQTTTTLTFDFAWRTTLDTSDPYYEQTPVAGDAYTISYTWDDLDDGTNILKHSSTFYSIVSSSVVISGNVFIAATNLGFDFSTFISTFQLTDNACLQFGEISSDYTTYNGCFLSMTVNGVDSVDLFGTTAGVGGDLLIYGGVIEVKGTAPRPFLRLYRSANHIARIVNTVISGKIGGRIQGTRSVLQSVDVSNNTNVAGSFTTKSPFGRLNDLRISNSYQGVYWFWDDSLTGRIEGITVFNCTNRVVLVTGTINTQTLTISKLVWDFSQSSNFIAVATGGSTFCPGTVQVSYPLLVKTFVGSALNGGARVSVFDNTNTLAYNNTSATGQYPSIDLIQRVYTAAQSNNAIPNRSYNSGTLRAPYTLRIRQFEYIFGEQIIQEIRPDSSDALGINFNFYKQSDSNITGSKATADALTGYSFNSGSATLTISASRTSQEDYNKIKAYLVDNPLVNEFASFSKGTGVLTISWNAVFASPAALGSRRWFVDGGIITLQASGNYSASQFTVTPTSKVNVTSGTTNLSEWTFEPGATIDNLSASAATVSIGAGQNANITIANPTAGGGAIVLQAPQVTLTLTDIVPDSEVIIRVSGTSTQLLKADVVGTSVNYGYTSLQTVDIAVYKEGYQAWRSKAFELPATSQSIRVQQEPSTAWREEA